MTCSSCFKSPELSTSTIAKQEPISTGRKVGGSIAALVAIVALATFIAILAAPEAAFIAAVAIALGGTTTSIAISSTLFAVSVVVCALIFAKPECAKSEKPEAVTVTPVETPITNQ